MNLPPVAPLGSVLQTQDVAASQLLPSVAPTQTGGSFSALLTDGIDQVNSKVIQADASVQAFALDDSIPVHQVTFALEQARLSLEVMMQVRARFVDAYQQFMNMQL